MTYIPDTVPSYVPKTKADQWCKVWNGVYDSALDDEDKSRDEAEARAFQAANAILSTRSISIKVGDFIGWKNDKGVRLRGKAVRYINASPPSDDDPEEIKDNPTDSTPMIEVEQWKPVRDGWEPMGKTVTVKLADCSKIDALDSPTRSGRKEAADETTSIRSAVVDFVSSVEEYVKSTKPGSDQQIKRLGANKIGGHAITWGSEEERDIEGDFFTKNTDIWLDVYQNQPIMFDHASGVKVPDDPQLPEDDQDMPRRYKLGHITKAIKDNIGLWIEAVVDAHNDWVEGVWELVDKGALYFSSGSVPHLIKRTSAGEIKSWPVIEVSLTPTPAEPRRTRVSALRSTNSVDRIADGHGYDGDGEQAQDGSEPAAEPNTKKSIRSNSMRMTKAQKRAASFLDAYWDDDLTEAIEGIKAARAAVNKKDATPDEVAAGADQVKEASSQLEQLVGPIADQAKSALGIDSGEAKAMLFKMALGRLSPAKQIPYDDTDDSTMQGDFGEDDDFTMQGDFEDEDAMMQGDFDEDDFTMQGDFEDEDAMMQGDFEDEDPYAMSARSARGGRSRRSAPRSRRNTDIEEVVHRVMDQFTERRGDRLVRKGPVTMGIAKPTGLVGFIKAAKDHDNYTLSRIQNKTNSHYKALGINPDTAGGYLVPPEHSDQIIELLRAQSIFIGEGGTPNNLVTVMPLNTETLTIPSQTGASTANWLGENATIPPSQETLGQIQLIARKLAVLVQVSNELLADASPDVDAFIRDDIGKSLRLEFDRAVLYGDGNGAEPRGVYNSNLTYKVPLNAAPDYDDLTRLVSQLEEQNVAVGDGSTAWVLHPRDKNAFRRLQDGNGAYIFASGALIAGETATPKTLLDYPWYQSTQVAKADIDGDDTHDETDVFFGHWKDVVVGMRKTIEVTASDVAGTSFQTYQTWIRAILRCDVAIRHPEAVAVLTDVREVVSA